MTSGARTLLSFLLGLRTIILIGSAGAIVGALLMFLQGARYLYHAWHDFFSGQQVVVLVLEAVDAFLFGHRSGDLRLWHRHRLRVHAARGLWPEAAELDEGGGVGQLKATLAEVVIVVLIVIFARVVVGTVDSGKLFDWPMLVLPGSIFLIAAALRMLELGGKGGANSEGGGH
jgi:hypothetical protein